MRSKIRQEARWAMKPEEEKEVFSKKRRQIVMIAIIAASIAWAVVEWLLLPDMVTVQISFSGASANMIPKLFGIILPLAISIYGAVMYRQRGKATDVVVAAVGLVLPAFTLAVNLL